MIEIPQLRTLQMHSIRQDIPRQDIAISLTYLKRERFFLCYERLENDLDLEHHKSDTEEINEIYV